MDSETMRLLRVVLIRRRYELQAHVETWLHTWNARKGADGRGHDYVVCRCNTLRHTLKYKNPRAVIALTFDPILGRVLEDIVRHMHDIPLSTRPLELPEVTE